MAKRVVLTINPDTFSELLAALEDAAEIVREDAERRASALESVVEVLEAQLESSLVEDDGEEGEEEKPS